MKKNTPIKRDKSLVILSRDHHDGLMLVWKIRQGIAMQVESARIANYVADRFDHELEPHFIEEESFVFLKLAPANELRIRAEKEHAEIRERIVAFRSATPAPPALLNFASLLESHIRFEERVLFPELEQTITREELDVMGKQIEQAHAAKTCPSWQDEFWIKK